jgi:hypothetical protein
LDTPRLISLSEFWNQLQQRVPREGPDLADWLHLGVDDVDGREIIKLVERTWANWPPALRSQFLATINGIVQAENAKDAWKERDQETQERYRKLALSAVAAARLAKQIAIWFPPP